MNILDKAQIVLNNYNSQLFYENLKKEVENKKIKKGYFCEKIGRHKAWFSRAQTRKPHLDTLVAIEREFNIDILKLAGLDKKKQAIPIYYEKNNNEEIIIEGKNIKLRTIYYKINFILSDPKLGNQLIGYIDALYDRLLESQKSKEEQIY